MAGYAFETMSASDAAAFSTNDYLFFPFVERLC